MLLLGLWWMGERVSPLARQLEEQLAAVLGPLTAAEAVSLAVLSGFAEELFFRGAVQGQWGWLAATVLFAVLHTGPGRAFRVWTLFAVVAGRPVRRADGVARKPSGAGRRALRGQRRQPPAPGQPGIWDSARLPPR